MENWHHIGFHVKAVPDLLPLIEKLGIEHSHTKHGPTAGAVSLDITESDISWPQIKQLLEGHQHLDMAQTLFSDDEILAAEWVRFEVLFERGYPEPENKWFDEPSNYSDLCQTCDTHRHAASFRIKKEPSMGKHNFMMLHWTDAIFCTPKMIETLAQAGIKGYEVWDVIIHNTDQPSVVIKQLYVPGLAKPGLVRVEHLEKRPCSECGMIKYAPHLIDKMYLKQEALADVEVDIVQGYEWFGHGKVAYREYIVSNRFARLAIEQKWQGIRFKVIDLVDD